MSNMEITRWGHAIIDDDTHLSKWVRETGLIDHGQNIEQTFRKYFKEGDVVVDVGACIGDHTVPYAQIVGPKGRVYAFEPHQLAYKCLDHNTRQFPWVERYNLGLGRCYKVMNVSPHANLGASFLDPVPYLADEKQITHVQPLDEFITPPSPIRFMKIDVEGFEIEVLEGAKKSILRDRPVLVIECAKHQERYGHTQQGLYRWLKEELPNYELTPSEHTGQPQYDIEARPR